MFRYSVITPMYNVAPYLPEFFTSLESQTAGFENIEVILVDDGSTDDGETLRLAQDFAAEHPANVILITQENGGQASARNAGIARASGEWLTFPDPDDVLNSEYFEEFEKALRQCTATVDVVSARLLLWHEGIDAVRDNHALAQRFHHGVVLRHLNAEPAWIQPHVTSALVRRSVVHEHGIRFPRDLRYRFEDGCFISDYLLRLADPTVLFVPAAHYLYRQRSDQSSTVQSTKSNPAKYTEHLVHGFEYLLDLAVRERGAVPRWLQNLILYDQFWILRASQGGETRSTMFPQKMYETLNKHLPVILQSIDDEAIDDFALMPTVPWMREAFRLIKGTLDHGPVYILTHDGWRGLRAYVYRYGETLPEEEIITPAGRIEPAYTKEQGLEYAGRPFVWQRTIWLPDDDEIQIVLNGVQQEILHRPVKPEPAYSGRLPITARPGDDQSSSEPVRHATLGGKVVAAFRRTLRVAARAQKAIRRRLKRNGLTLVKRDVALHSPRFTRKFENAWVFIDRDVDANDSAEDLYSWIKENHPEINSWFVVRRTSRDWMRLQRAGARLVPYGEPEFYALLANAAYLASSHADRFITDALPRKIKAKFTFVFLQHGVIKGDISGWLNSKRIGVFVTSTEDEYRYITGASPYKFGTKEVRLTGLPRHDVLREMSARLGSRDAKRILIMPTWRNYLVSGMTTDSQTRESVRGFHDTDYAQNWQRLLLSPRLVEAAEAGYEIVFMPHPNMQGYLNHFAAPDHIRVASYSDTNVRAELVGSTALITDYSSMAFNAAYLDIPVIYFQFDRDEYLAGHTERPGYFDYERDGFGPVNEEPDAVAEDVIKIIAGAFAERYYERMRTAFPVRDGGNRQRVYEAMIEARTRQPQSVRCRSTPPEYWTDDSHAPKRPR